MVTILVTYDNNIFHHINNEFLKIYDNNFGYLW